MSTTKKEEIEFGIDPKLSLCKVTITERDKNFNLIYLKISGKTEIKKLTLIEKIKQIFKLIFKNYIDAEIIWFPTESNDDKNISGYNQMVNLTESIIKFME